MKHSHIASLVALIAGSVVGLAWGDEQPKAGGTPASAGAAQREQAAGKQPPEPPQVDLTKQPTLYVVGYAHLDTEWRWAYPQTIREFIANTLHDNFKLIDEYPSYVFNFSGSRRYQMMREYYPEEYAKLKQYIAQGRWFPCGSSVDENDANVPSAESYVRHILYGNRYFRKEFRVASDEYMLPDCFGFPAALPSLLAHCGLKGFSTQKLTWGLAIGQIPFKVGVWEGPDGSSVIAALDPGAYVGEVKENLATSEGWSKRIDNNGSKSGLYVDYHYYGTGDQGGAPKAGSVRMVEESVNTTSGHTKVISGPADWMFKSIPSEKVSALPKYKGELELTEHSAGSISSQAYMKRWNRKNEQLADAAERAAIGAWWVGAAPYPSQRLEDAWSLVLGSQMHDILPGTSLPKAYEYAWNDEVLASNVFADVLQRSVGSVSDGMDTRAEGAPVVLYNPLAMDREDVVELTIPWTGDPASGVEAVGPKGEQTPVQVIEKGSGWFRVVMSAKVPSAGFAVYDLRPRGMSSAMAPAKPPIRVSDRAIENERYSVKLDDSGDVVSIMDKSLNKEMLSGPARLGLHFERPANWPAWNQDWADRQKPVKGYVGGAGDPVKITVVESGPVRGAIRVEREHEGSIFVQDIRLAAGNGGGAGDSLVFHTRIDWNTKERSLRAAFPLAAANKHATYDIQTGVIERGNGSPKQYEYAAHEWFDLTDDSGAFGCSILNDCKYASDKPDDHTLRQTLVYTPGVRGGYVDQGTQDLGRHEMDYAFYSHAGDWRAAKTPWVAARLNQPIRAFLVPKHAGPLGKSVSLLSCNNPSVMVTAVKKAEDSGEIVVRLRELTGQAAQNVHVKFAGAAEKVREIDGQERDIGPAKVDGGELVADVRGYGLKAYGVVLNATSTVKPVQSASVTLPYDTDVASTNRKRDDGQMEAGRAYPAEQIPAETTIDGVTFKFGPTADGQNNAVACNGQEVALPGADFDRVEILAAASDSDTKVAFEAGGKQFPLTVQQWRGYVGQWDNRRWAGKVDETDEHTYKTMAGLDPGYIKPDSVAWFCSHHHAKDDAGKTFDDWYKYSYMFRYTIDLPKGASSVKLPSTPGVKIMAMTAVRGTHDHAVAAAPLRDMLADHAATPMRVLASGDPADAQLVTLAPSLYWHAGGVRYTTDGSDPTPTSPPYDKPFWLSRSATVKAASFDYQGQPGPIAATRIEVKDTTAPTVKSAWAEYQAPKVHVEFSEPVDAASASAANAYGLAGAGVTGAELAADAMSVTLTLDKPLATDTNVDLKLSGIKDPAGNAMKSASVAVAAKGPVYHLATLDADHKGSKIEGVKKLPTGAEQPWTINMWVKPAKQPANHTVFAGFGRCEDRANGTGRYLCKFANGIHFWSRNADVEGRTELDIGQWQMLTATYDGQTVRLYKNGAKIAEQAMSLADDEPTISVTPKDPWDHRYQFDGDLREFTVWNACLSADSLKVLKDSFKE